MGHHRKLYAFNPAPPAACSEVMKLYKAGLEIADHTISHEKVRTCACSVHAYMGMHVGAGWAGLQQ